MIGAPWAVGGVDGCKSGWVLAGMGPDGSLGLELHSAIDTVLERVSGVVAIDMPIGLPEAGPRACDLAARGLLGARRHSVFPAPLRSMLEARSHAEACALGRRTDGRGLSLQSWNLIPKIREVDEYASRVPAGRLIEVHPELSFRGMQGGHPLFASKKTEEGRQQRAKLLRQAFADWLPQRAPAGSGVDDVLDAFAALWTALRHRDGLAVPTTAAEERDARGLLMQIHW
ncbi:MAG: DUF429 domain-containing protein [Candidatus Sericytochromatia bacterium]|nr:DUF429 domain-containing protein [Candidatus Sericytochromatia bacterium]